MNEREIVGSIVSVHCVDKEVTTRDGFTLSSTHYQPADAPRAGILINSAMAVPRRFYGDFANWLAERDYYVVTYDYRGIGDSRPDSLRGFRATIGDWARYDIPAMVQWFDESGPADRLYVVGHSLGGQVMGLLGDRHPIDAMATFSAQSGYWKLQHPQERWRLLIASYVIFPVLTYSFGYLPWSKLFGGEDIPKAVALQWARWCRSPQYLMSDESLNRDGFSRFNAPILSYSFEDDVWGYKRSVDWLMDRYDNTDVHRVHVHPEDYGVERIGHFGFFERGMEPAWEDLLERLGSL